MQVGEKGTFRSSCGLDITGTIVEISESGYVVKGDDIQSNQHEDGLFRFTFG
jgi:hypothetical protein